MPCLRIPDPRAVATPAIAVDLPTRDRAGIADRPPCNRYRLAPLGDRLAPKTIWVFQVPAGIVGDRNNIFNSRASSPALIQTSGALMSLAQEWSDTFEAEMI